MFQNARLLNVVMSGGGVKGIAYVGVFDAIRRAGFIPQNTAGTSAGALAAVLAGAGYDAQGMWEALEALKLDKLHSRSLVRKVPAVKYLAAFANGRYNI
jgi:NTE family protein